VRGQPAVDVPHSLAREPHDDSRRAKPALRSAGGDERFRDTCRVEAFQRRDRTTRNTCCRCYARDARRTVDEHRATAALALGRAAVLHRNEPEPFAQDVQQGFIGRDRTRDRIPVAGKREVYEND
jgi:hypothetical protein